MLRLAAGPRARAPAEVNGELDALDAFDHLVIHVDGKIGGAIRVVVPAPHVRVDEQAQMRIVDLNDRDVGLAEQLDLAA